MSETNRFLVQLYDNQLKDVPVEMMLNYKGLNKLAEYLDNNIFESSECCYYSYNNKKKDYIYNKGKKWGLKKIIYMNYIGNPTKYHIKNTCVKHKNIQNNCVNLKHLIIKKQDI